MGDWLGRARRAGRAAEGAVGPVLGPSRPAGPWGRNEEGMISYAGGSVPFSSQSARASSALWPRGHWGGNSSNVGARWVVPLGTLRGPSRPPPPSRQNEGRMTGRAGGPVPLSSQGACEYRRHRCGVIPGRRRWGVGQFGVVPPLRRWCRWRHGRLGWKGGEGRGGCYGPGSGALPDLRVLSGEMRKV